MTDRTRVVMPQMGESITEGTVVRWLKKVGEPVERDEPLLEISTDKVDAEIPAPISGRLAEILVVNGDTVLINSILGTIEPDSHAAMAGPVERQPNQIAVDSSASEVQQGSAGVLRAEEVRPLSTMRKAIAEHMVVSRRTSAHVHSVFHVDFSELERFRKEKKPDFERAGARLTLTSLVARVVVGALLRHPIINASLQGDNVVYKNQVNPGIAVAVPDGLMVPVIENADQKSLIELSRAIADVAERARAKRLTPADRQVGTFTITNPGQFGAQFDLPIIHQPQTAILGIGVAERRPVVVGDAVGIRTMSYLTLGYDHRLIDGDVAAQFMADVTHGLEAFEISSDTLP